MRFPGLELKRYWRQLFSHSNYHCFRKAGPGVLPKTTPMRRYVSLCDKYMLIESEGQASRRPPPALRCAQCDGREITLMGASESLPERPDWKKKPIHHSKPASGRRRRA